MADLNEKWEDNVPGKFYVDKECILCSLCSDLAPNNFKESGEGDHDIVYKQPEGGRGAEAVRGCARAVPGRSDRERRRCRWPLAARLRP